MARVGGTDKNSGKLIERSTYVSLTVMERKVVEEQAYTQSAASLPPAPRNLELLAARKSDLPLTRFPLRGKAGAGGFPPRRWPLCTSKKRWHTSMPRLPPQEGFQSAPLKPPLRIPPVGTTGASRWSGSICGIEREKKLRMAATSALTFTTFS